MAKVGGGNPLPFEIGGGDSSSELAYRALKAAVGKGGSAAEGTIEAAWRWAKARALRAGFCEGRAANCYFPGKTVDGIPVYEAILGLVPAPNATDEERRQDILPLWIGTDDVSVSWLEEQLQAIDSRFSIVTPDHDTVTVTKHGRAFEDWTPADPDACGPDFGGGRDSTGWPNYSGDFHCIVKYDLPAGAITMAAQNTIERAKVLLNEALPAWVDFMFVRTITGFVLDTDLLDFAGFGS